MWESIYLTLAATAGNNIGKVLQKKGTFSSSPLCIFYPFSLSSSLGHLSFYFCFILSHLCVTRAYAANKAWIIGFLVDICSALLILVVLNGWLRVYRHQRKAHEMMDYEVVEEIIYGVESGIMFGMASVISKMGFIFLEQGFSRMLGLKHGRALLVFASAAVALIVTSVLAGMQGEQFPLFIVAGVILLVSSTWLLRQLPLRHFIRVDQDLSDLFKPICCYPCSIITSFDIISVLGEG
ncbi:hypothetical protein SADUNF_Sadunf18G0045700 [Salix dunnii]|uniref:Uncharacterized protein n=1 Tax=Salix dunnii TaxID=1413687 RepID=A0A835J7S2_9ROSI|nr:hypothetical protein SADUNF_Sadunf18G0045700 [Salix dunnii]